MHLGHYQLRVAIYSHYRFKESKKSKPVLAFTLGNKVKGLFTGMVLRLQEIRIITQNLPQ